MHDKSTNTISKKHVAILVAQRAQHFYFIDIDRYINIYIWVLDIDILYRYIFVEI